MGTGTTDRANCFHCGDPVPETVSYGVVIAGASHPMCCPGCAAIARAIAENGMEAWYTLRTGPARPAQAIVEDASPFDLPAYQRGIVRCNPDSSNEATLVIEGMTCGACIWLIESRLAALPGVLEASVNFTTHLCRVRWNPDTAHLSTIVTAVRSVGYGATPCSPLASAAHGPRHMRGALWRFGIAAIGMMQVMMLSIPTYYDGGDISADIASLLRWASLCLTVPVVVFSASGFFAQAWRELRVGRAGMDVPVSLGIAVAFATSLWSTLTGAGEVYFDSVVMFVFLLLGARLLEARVRRQAADAIERVAGIVPAFALRLISTGNSETHETVAVASLAPGDRLLVPAGDRVPADGVVERGESETDEALLSGEPIPVRKCPGARVIGGSMNTASPLVIRVEQVGADTVLAGIVRLADRAQSKRPAITVLADRVGAAFTVFILAAAAVSAAAWAVIEPARALSVAIAVLVITCPCALAIAVPAALSAVHASLMRLGILVVGGHALETLARVRHIVFDKTGTLTAGRLSLVGVMPLGTLGRDACLALAARIEINSRHPCARALVEANTSTERGAVELIDVREVAGAGLEATFEGRRVRIGSPAFVAALNGLRAPTELAFVADPMVVTALGDESGWIALFTFNDPIRSDARALIAGLRARGIAVSLLTGDRPAVARCVAQILGIDEWRAGFSPDDKAAFVRALQDRGATVAAVGDGVNDAPVMAQAQVSIAMGGGTDLAQSHADVILASGRIGALTELFESAVRSRRVIRQNLAWAVLYNVVAMPLAVFGLVSPLLAAVGMSASSIMVVLNGLRAAHPAAAQSMPRRLAQPRARADHSTA